MKREIEIEACDFCEAIFDALCERAKDELGPYDDKEYWMRREIEKIAKRLVNEEETEA